MTLYTAVGRCSKKRNKDGQTEPVVTVNGKKYSLTAHELLLYASLYGEILTFDELKREFYEKERDAHILGELSFEHYLNRMIMRGLVVSGRDVVGYDALYDLLSHLYIRPIRKPFLSRFIPLHHKDLPLMEWQVLTLCHDQLLSTAELMQCLENGILHLKNNQELMDRLYDDEETNYQNIAVTSRFTDVHVAVLKAVANLYLKRIVLFESL